MNRQYYSAGKALEKFTARVLLAIVALLLMCALGASLTGCASGVPAGQVDKVAYTQACATYGAAFDVVLQLRKAGRLNDAQIEQVTLIDGQVTPLCTGPMPANADAAVSQITAAVTTLTILEAIKP